MDLKEIDLDLCIEKAKELLDQKEDIKEELTENKKTTCGVNTKNYILEIIIKKAGD